MKDKNKMNKINRIALGLIGGFCFLPTQIEASTLSPEGAQAYLDIVSGYQNTYGTVSAVAKDSYDTTIQTGLAQSRLLDLNGDGDLELQVLYISKVGAMDDGRKYFVGKIEFWDENGNTAHMIHSSNINNFEEYGYYGEKTEYQLYRSNEQWGFFTNFTGSSAGFEDYTATAYLYQGTDFRQVDQLSVSQHHSFTDAENSSNMAQIEKFRNNYTGDSIHLITSSGGQMGSGDINYLPTTSCVTDLQNFATAPSVVEESVEVAEEKVEKTEIPFQSAEFAQHNTKITGSTQAQYLEILQNYHNQYGTSNGSSQGLASSHLLDLDGNGTEELVLTLCTQTNPVSIRTEVWEIIDSTATQTFVHAQNQKHSAKEDWRDVGFLYQYNGGWIFYTAGGGGTDPYFSYDRVFSYKNNTFQMIDETYLTRWRMFGDVEGSYQYLGYVTGGSAYGYYGSDESSTKVATAIPDWYNGFKRIQNQYFSGSQIELFYMDKSTYSWEVSSVASSLEGTEKTEEIILPVAESQEKFPRYQVYQQVILNIQNQYGTSSGVDEGYAFSYLKDFTGDGQEELLIGYDVQMGYFARNSGWPEYADVKSNIFAIEIWKMEDNVPVKAYSFITDGELSGVESRHQWSLVEDGGIWKILYEYRYAAIENDTVVTFENGSFTEKQVSKQSYPQNISLLSADSGSNIIWDTQTCDRELAEKLAYYSGSDHFFGYPVVFDEEIHSLISNLDLNGELLAVYQVDEPLFYVIVDVNGNQECRLVQSTDGTFNLLSSHTENLSYDALEEEKGNFLALSSSNGDNGGESGNKSTNNTEEQSKNSKNNVLFFTWIGLIVVLSTGLMVTLKKMKNPKNPPSNS